jgi:ankyrin repeat protein
MLNFDPDDRLAVAAVEAIRSGDVDALQRLLRDDPGLATARIGGSRTLLHVATDWPGNFANSAATVAALIAAGAEVNARFTGAHTETPLHWAASCDDVAALDALLDHGADIEAPGAVIGGGTPLADAVAFGQWRAARRLVERGARTTLWQAAALGLMGRIKEDFANIPPPTPQDVTNAFWCACHGGQRSSAQYLLDRGADLNWIGHDELTPLDTASRSGAAELVDWLRGQGAKSAKDLH